MSQADRIHEVIFDAIREVRDLLPSDAVLEPARGAPLMATAGGALDSLGVVNLMVAVESRMERAFSRPVSLADALGERPEESPFRTVSTLADHLESMLLEDRDA